MCNGVAFFIMSKNFEIGDKVVVEGMRGEDKRFNGVEGIIIRKDHFKRICIVSFSKTEFLKKGLDVNSFYFSSLGTVVLPFNDNLLKSLEKRKFFNFCIFKRLWRKI